MKSEDEIILRMYPHFRLTLLLALEGAEGEFEGECVCDKYIKKSLELQHLIVTLNFPLFFILSTYYYLI